MQPQSRKESAVATWHYGVVAHWWAQFKVGGPEVEFFGQFVKDGQPALDAACGTGRLMVPYLRAGYDVDGCDVSADMLALCREAAEGVGRQPTLYAQAIHDLDVARRYRTIFVCGGFGLGTTRDQDFEGLRRIYASLLPGGLLVMDNEVPYADPTLWRHWSDRTLERSEPESATPVEGQRGRDGCDYALRQRLVALDPLAQRATREIHGWQWRDDKLLTSETHALTENFYFRNELVMMLERTGFRDIRVIGGYHGGEPIGDEQFLVYRAHKPAD